MTVVKCQGCRTVLEEPQGTPIEERTPCPECGSLQRHFEVSLEGTVSFHAQLGWKARRGGKGKPFLEGKTGDDLYRKTGRWNKLLRRIDRECDWYDEAISDPATGDIIKETHEPLSEHHDHGSTKWARPKQER